MSATAKNQIFTAIHTVGTLLPSDMLTRISEGKDVPGAKPADYHLFGAASVRDDAERRWEYLKGAWVVLRDKLSPEVGSRVPADPTGLAIANWLEPLFAELGFGRIRKTGETGITSDDGTKQFAISHLWERIPIHLTSWDADLDKRLGPGLVPPQSLVQECLNRTEAHLWAMLSNGRQLRLLRDSTSLVGASYVEFDLEAIFDGELFSEFVLLYRLLHVSRFDVAAGALASTCWLEKWRVESIESGTRALDQLRVGVQTAITCLGTGFTSHPANAGLRANLEPELFKKALLRLVYRLVILFVAEDRDLLIPADADPATREQYEKYFSTVRLRATAGRRRGSAHTDRWQALCQVFDGLGREEGFPQVGLPGLGGIYDNAETDEILRGLSLSNETLLTAIRALSVTRDTTAKRNRAVDYRHLDAEELGSIYESLLELVPRYDPGDRSFQLVELAGNERKTTGSYYTPTSLISCLLDSALDPVLDDAQKRGELAASANPKLDRAAVIAEELLKTTVCDPACGSGHFLVAAARRIAKRVAAVREQNPEPTINAVRTALREVIGRCIYGVDLNPMAVELAKVSLWLEALEPGKALNFLDAHIKHGNSLLGTTPALQEAGIPDDAFKSIEGDDSKWVTQLRKTNLAERTGQESLFELNDDEKISTARFAVELEKITRAKANSLAEVHLQAAAFREWATSLDYLHAKNVADAWCAAFVWIKTPEAPPAITWSLFRALKDPDRNAASYRTRAEILRLTNEYRFFHWHLEFPDIFQTPPSPGADINATAGWSNGFSCILGNPPWERVRVQKVEFFAQRDEAIARAPNAAVRKRMIEELARSNSSLAEDFSAAKRRADCESHFLRFSVRYPLTGHGELNTFSMFSETARMLLGQAGRVGIIVPTGIATNATTQIFFRNIVETMSLASLYDFENRQGIFPAVDSTTKFCLLTLSGHMAQEPQAQFAFYIHNTSELDEPGRRFFLTPEEIILLNPNTGTCPIFRSRRDADITLDVYRRVPILIKEDDSAGNPWGISVMRMFDMSHDSALFKTRKVLESDGWTLSGNRFVRSVDEMLPLYEGKMLHHYDHHWATYTDDDSTRDILLAEKQDPTTVAMPHYWIAKSDVDARLALNAWERDWLFGWRDIAKAVNERTAISFVFDKAASGNKVPLMFVDGEAEESASLTACQGSFVLDYVSRQKISGTTMNLFIWQQLPVLTPAQLGPHTAFTTPRALELTYTAYDMEPFARDLGDKGAPFRWDEDRRFLMRAELDALFFHLYGIERDDVDYIMDTFPIVKRKDEAKYGAYRTKDQILEIYDAMARATASGTEYQTILSPAPGHGARHPARKG
jgi:N-6 DNA Methylase